jgi:hypothetical protein
MKLTDPALKVWLRLCLQLGQLQEDTAYRAYNLPERRPNHPRTA